MLWKWFVGTNASAGSLDVAEMPATWDQVPLQRHFNLVFKVLAFATERLFMYWKYRLKVRQYNESNISHWITLEQWLMSEIGRGKSTENTETLKWITLSILNHVFIYKFCHWMGLNVVLLFSPLILILLKNFNLLYWFLSPPSNTHKHTHAHKLHSCTENYLVLIWTVVCPAPPSKISHFFQYLIFPWRSSAVPFILGMIPWSQYNI